MPETPPGRRVKCPQCAKPLRIPEKLTASKIRCPNCQAVLRLGPPAAARQAVDPSSTSIDGETRPEIPQKPARTKADAAQARQRLEEKRADDLLAGVNGTFPRPRVTMGHRLSAVLVVGILLTLPLVYFAFAAGVAWLTYWHATHDWVWMTHVRGRGAVFVGMAYVGLIVMGALWVIAMIRPIFRRIPASNAEGITRADQPRLFLFAERLADLVGAPRPEVITLIPEINAYASYETTRFGFGQKRFRLAIGLPLLAGLSLEQLTGVIAHEFGHFSQRRSLLLHRFIWRLNLWFEEVISSRDVLDELVEGAMEDDNFGVNVLGYLAYALLSTGRYLLRGLAMIGHFFSSSLSKQMEYDADQYECGVVGSRIYVQTSERMGELMIAGELGIKHAFEGVDANYLPANLFAFIAGLCDGAPAIRKKAKKRIQEERNSLISTHPPTRLRIAAAEKLNLPGIFSSALPASSLVPDLEDHCQGMTSLMYFLQFGPTFNRETLRPTQEAVDNYLAIMRRR